MKEYLNQAMQGIMWLYNQMHWFTDKEAWWIYRLAAILEAVGWGLLLTAIVYRRLGLPEADSFVTVAGRVHGIFFVAYFAGVLATFRSMGWGIWRLFIALLAGIPPFTGLVFEQIMSWHRKKYPVVITPPRNVYDD